MKTIVTFSGGKDSLAALLWIRNNFTKNFTTVFCDTGWTIEVIKHILGFMEAINETNNL
jgi:3'-phosphoadenosine 5'-phosphosulfate sulfotransferase (PAPS reductase)/FAD synthetase